MFRTIPLSIIRSFSLHTQQFHTDLLIASEQDQDGTSWPCSQAVSKPVWHTPLLCVQWKTPDDGQKHVEFYSKNKFEKLVHLVDFIIRMLPNIHGAITDISGDCWPFIFVVKPSFTTSKISQRTQIRHFTKHQTIYMYFPFEETFPVLHWKVMPITQGTAIFPALGPLSYRQPQCHALNLNGLFQQKWPIEHSCLNQHKQKRCAFVNTVMENRVA